MIELKCYCDADLITIDLVEKVVGVAEGIIQEPIDRVVRNLFPQPPRHSIAHEIELAWKAQRPLRISNKLSSRNRLEISASRVPYRNNEGTPKHYGAVEIHILETAPTCTSLADNLAEFVAITNAIFARADSSRWWQSQTKEQASNLRLFRLKDDWTIVERLAWKNYWSPLTRAHLKADVSTFSGFSGTSSPLGAGTLVSLSDESFEFSRPEHWRSYLAINELFQSAQR